MPTRAEVVAQLQTSLDDAMIQVLTSGWMLSLIHIQKTWARQNIRYEKAAAVKKDIAVFLKQFAITLDDAAYTK